MVILLDEDSTHKLRFYLKRGCLENYAAKKSFLFYGKKFAQKRYNGRLQRKIKRNVGNRSLKIYI